MSEPDIYLPCLIDVDTINEQFDASEVECLRCGKCCKIPFTDRMCKYLEWVPSLNRLKPVRFDVGSYDPPKLVMSNKAHCTIYGSRNGRLIDEVPEGQIFCLPRMYEKKNIPGCAYQPKIDIIEALIKNGS